MSDSDAQADEILALISIYGDETFTINDSKDNDRPSGSLLVSVEIAEPLIITSLCSGNSRTAQHLPPICLNFNLPRDYPSRCPPEYNLSCLWLTDLQLSSLSDYLDSLWDINRGSVILFIWRNFLQLETIEFLNIISPWIVEDGLYCVVFNHDEMLAEQSFLSSAFLCNICYLEKPGAECAKLVSCGHVYCRACLRDYFEMQIHNGNVFELRCPTPQCDSDVSPSLVHELVDAKEYERYDRLLLQHSVDSVSDIQECPSQRCGLPVVIDNEGLGLCPHCTLVFCGSCRMASHGVEPCRTLSVGSKLLSEYCAANTKERQVMVQRYGKEMINRLLEDGSSEKYMRDTGKQCPCCRAWIEKTDGCNKILCTKCRTYFCWICQAVISRSDPYGHYRDTSSACHNKLFLGVPQDAPFVDDGEWLGEGPADIWFDEAGNIPPANHNLAQPVDHAADWLVDQIEQFHFEDWVVPAEILETNLAPRSSGADESLSDETS